MSKTLNHETVFDEIVYFKVVFHLFLEVRKLQVSPFIKIKPVNMIIIKTYKNDYFVVKHSSEQKDY